MITHTHTGIRKLEKKKRPPVFCICDFMFIELGFRQRMYKFFAGDANTSIESSC